MSQHLSMPSIDSQLSIACVLYIGVSLWIMYTIYVYVTGFWKTVPNHTFLFSVYLSLPHEHHCILNNIS